MPGLHQQGGNQQSPWTSPGKGWFHPGIPLSFQTHLWNFLQGLSRPCGFLTPPHVTSGAVDTLSWWFCSSCTFSAVPIQQGEWKLPAAVPRVRGLGTFWCHVCGTVLICAPGLVQGGEEEDKMQVKHGDREGVGAQMLFPFCGGCGHQGHIPWSPGPVRTCPVRPLSPGQQSPPLSSKTRPWKE